MTKIRASQKGIDINMEHTLSLDSIPKYNYASFRFFEEHEKHMTRVAEKDVLLLVFGGELKFTEDGVPTTVSAGEYYIQRRGIFQTATEESNSPKYYFIHFTGEFDKGKKQLPIRGNVDFSEVFPLLKKLDALRMANESNLEKTAVFLEILSVLKKQKIFCVAF